MAFFTTKTWRDRQAEHAGRRTLKNVSTNEETVYDVTRNEGQVSVVGNPFSASEMNDLEGRIESAMDGVQEALDEKLDGTGLTTDYNAVITVGAQDAAPANSVIKQLYQNFLDGCSRIAAAITGGRDGSGTGGVATASNASVATMATNIRSLANLNYNSGYQSKTLRRTQIGSGGNGTYSAAAVPGYQNMSAANFAFVPTNATATAERNPGSSGGGGGTGTLSPSISYNSATGVVTVSGCSHGSYGTADAHVGSLAITGVIYAYYAE